MNKHIEREKMRAQDGVIIFYVPFPDYQSAEHLSKRLLEKKLIFCSNIFENMHALYLWKGEIQQGQEVVMIAKTLISLKVQAQELIESAHPYEQVVVMSLLSDGCSQSLLNWAAEELKK